MTRRHSPRQTRQELDIPAAGLWVLTWAGRFVIAGLLGLVACIASLTLLTFWPAETGPVAALAAFGTIAGIGWVFVLGGLFGAVLAALMWRVEE